MPWLVHDGKVLATLEVADVAPRPDARPARPRPDRRCAAARTGPVDPHRPDAVRHRRRLLRSRPGGAARRHDATEPARPARPGGRARSSRPRPGRSSGGAISVGDRLEVKGRAVSDGRLVLVATPIGNLGDLSPRAVDELARADAVACEDTRRTGRLLAHAGVTAPKLLVVNDHTEAAAGRDVLARLDRGERVAVVSDAGMPGVSDPGERLVRLAVGRGTRRRGRAGTVGRDHRAGGQRAGDGPVGVRGLPAPARLGPHRAAGRAGRRTAHDRALRGPSPAGPDPGRPGRRHSAAPVRWWWPAS